MSGWVVNHDTLDIEKAGPFDIGVPLGEARLILTGLLDRLQSKAQYDLDRVKDARRRMRAGCIFKEPV